MNGGTEFGPWLRQRRRAFDLTQQELASRVGCSTETIAKIETGERKPSKQVAERLAEWLNIAADEQEAFIRFARADSPGNRSLFPIHADDSSPWRAVHQRRQLRQDNLPAQPNLFVGRERQLDAAVNLLRRRGVRLLSLIGPPGIGKTRLALQVATEMLEVFGNGVCFVGLASITDPHLVASTIARRLGLREAGRRPLSESLKNYLRDKSTLLVLDNFEQVLPAAALVAELLAAAPYLKVLVTSRTALNVYGEFKLKIPPMDMPDRRYLPPIQAMIHYEAIELFVERALSANPDFTLTQDNAEAISEVCHLLDGLPLAIELAAARTEFLSPQTMLERLEGKEPGSTLKLLTGGPTNLPARQRTLRGAVNWSYSLLSPEEQLLFRRLSVFVGGFTLEAACALCATDTNKDAEDGQEPGAKEQNPSSLVLSPSSFVGSEATLTGLRSLVDASLLQQEGRGEHEEQGKNPKSKVESPKSVTSNFGLSTLDKEGDENSGTRFSMLETVRDYGLERLAEHDELEMMGRRHAHYYLALAEQAAIELRGPNQAGWLERLENEQDNLRAALRWVTKTREIEMGLRIAGALGWFWFRRGYFSEGRDRLLQMLSLAEMTKDEGRKTKDENSVGLSSFVLRLDAARARALSAVARLVEHQGDYGQALAMYEESRQICLRLDDSQGVAYALCGLAFTNFREGSQNQAKQLYEQALSVFRELEDERGIATSIRGLGDVTLSEGDYLSARSLYTESLTLFRKLGDKYIVATLLNGLGNAALDYGDLEPAHSLYEDGLTIFRELGDKYGIAGTLMGLAEVARCQGDYESAASLNEESLSIWRVVGEKWNMAMALHNLGHVIQHQGDLARAGSIFAESLLLFHEAGAKVGIAMCLTGLAGVAAARAEPGPAERATRLFGAAQALLDATGTALQAADLSDHTHNVSLARSQLDQRSFRAAWAEGSVMALEDAVTYALDGV